MFTDEKEDEFRTPHQSQWPKWTLPGYLNYYVQKHGNGHGASAAPQRVDPMFAAGTEGKPKAQHAFLDPKQNASIPSSEEPVGSTPQNYTTETDPWYTNVGDVPQEPEAPKKQETTPRASHVAKDAIPPTAYDPSSESAGEEEIDDDEEWIYPTIPSGLRYERYLKTSKSLADKIGSVKLLVQPSFALKPMIEEAVVPSKAIKSTYACYVRKVTSYIAVWSGYIPMKLLRRYRLKDDADWIRLYNHCLLVAQLKNAHLYLRAKDLAALCGVLPEVDVVSPILKQLTSQRFLNDAAGSPQVSSGIRTAATGLFTDFDVVRTSNSRNRINTQSALSDQFAWANIHHVATEIKSDKFECQCLEVIADAAEYVEQLWKRSEEVKAGTSIHIWLSFNEFVHWSRDGASSHFSFEETLIKDIVSALADLVSSSFGPVFVSLCSSSNFFHGDEMPMGETAKKIAIELARVGVPVTHNSALWSECANFINYKSEAINPKSAESTSSNLDQWDSFAAFACLDKFLFREKMLYCYMHVSLEMPPLTSSKASWRVYRWMLCLLSPHPKSSSPSLPCNVKGSQLRR